MLNVVVGLLIVIGTVLLLYWTGLAAARFSPDEDDRMAADESMLWPVVFGLLVWGFIGFIGLISWVIGNAIVGGE